MTQDSIRAFVKENFGKGYFPVYHGRTNLVTPLALIVNRKRKWWKRPFGKTEMIVLADLDNYVMTNQRKLFNNDCKSKLQKENKKLEKTEVADISSYVDVLIEGLDVGEVELLRSEHPGDPELGELTEEYFLDPDLRGILSAAELDPEMMRPLESQHLLLVTDVVYSTKFVLTGNRKHQTTVSGDIHLPSEMTSWLRREAWVRGHVTKTKVPPPMVKRGSRAPFLFKFCRVVYDREIKRLRIRDGDFVGRRSRGGHTLNFAESFDDYQAGIFVAGGVNQGFSHGEEPDYEESVLHLKIAESLSQDSDPITLTADDFTRVENIKQLLLTQEPGLPRKILVLESLQLFERIVTEDKKQLSLNKPLTSNECGFFHKLGIRARPRQLILRVDSATKNVIQEYGVLFKLLSELSAEQWKEFEGTLTMAQDVC